MGMQSGYSNVSGSKNTCLCYRAGFTNASGHGNVFLGYTAGYNETGSNKLYIDNTSTTTPLIYGDFSSNRVGINRSNPSFTLDVNGTIRGNNVSASDVRLKEDISSISNALDKIERLRSVNFKWIDKSRGERTQIGVIAQEMEKVIPELVFVDNEGIK